MLLRGDGGLGAGSFLCDLICFCAAAADNLTPK
jgi:hypothetical protein